MAESDTAPRTALLAGARRLGFDAVVIAQPSLLLGDRGALGQPTRAAEVWIARLLGPVMALVPRGVRLLSSGDMQR